MLGPVELWGVVNVTPDSFSDGGQFFDPARAITHAHTLAAEGADVIDVGAESTRPGAERLSVEEELRRLIPVVTELVAAGHTVSVDTMNAATADEMLSRGVSIVNDVSGGLADDNMFRVIAGAQCRYVLMHWRGPSEHMNDLATYSAVTGEVTEHLRDRLGQAVEAGIDLARITLDPGFGFSKNPEHNWELVRGIEDIVALGQPVLAGVSRKRFIGELFDHDHTMADRDAPSAMLGAVLATRGVASLRVHSISQQRRALEIMKRAGEATDV